MLPLVQAACVRLASGTNPYGSAYAMPWELPLTLWPGLWLPYMVPHSLALDLRWVHIAVVVCLTTLFGLFIVRSTSDLTTRGQATLAASFCALFLFLFSSEFVFFAGIAHTPPLWMWLGLLAVTVMLRRPWWSAVFLGLAMASRQTAAVYAPLMAIYWSRMPGASLGRTSCLCVVSSVTFLLVTGPFLFPDPVGFLITPIRHYAELGRLDSLKGIDSYAADTIGLTFVLRGTSLAWLPATAMMLSVIGLLSAAGRWLRTGTDALVFMGSAGITVALFAPIPWHYEYLPPLLLLSFAAISAAEERESPASASAPRLPACHPPVIR